MASLAAEADRLSYTAAKLARKDGVTGPLTDEVCIKYARMARELLDSRK